MRIVDIRMESLGLNVGGTLHRFWEAAVALSQVGRICKGESVLLSPGRHLLAMRLESANIATK